MIAKGAGGVSGLSGLNVNGATHRLGRSCGILTRELLGHVDRRMIVPELDSLVQAFERCRHRLCHCWRSS